LNYKKETYSQGTRNNQESIREGC